ncbi:MAG: DUF2470 domain-containing protein [Micromonosporaceae bacterium]
MYEPTPAERARTVLRVAPSVSVLTETDEIELTAVSGADGAGSPLLIAAGTWPADRLDEISCVVHAVDVSPTPLRDRVRGEVWLGGWLAAVPYEGPATITPPVGDGLTLLRLEVAEVQLRCRVFGGGLLVDIDPDEYAAATVDPLADGEAEWLSHMMAAHTAEFAQLCALVPEQARPAGSQLRPLALDRYGLLLRIDSDAGHRQVRLPFRTPVDCPGRLPDAMAELLHAAAAYHTEKGL